MKMKKLSALILCFTMLLSMSFSAEVYAHEEDIMRTENYQKTKAFVDSGDIYDLGLYSMEDAVRIIGRQDPDFADHTLRIRRSLRSRCPWPLWLS